MKGTAPTDYAVARPTRLRALGESETWLKLHHSLARAGAYPSPDWPRIRVESDSRPKTGRGGVANAG